MSFTLADAIVGVVVVCVWNKNMPAFKQVTLNATGVNLSLPDNLISNAGTGVVKDGLVGAFLELLSMYWSLPWWWHLITAFISYCIFDK